MALRASMGLVIHQLAGNPVPHSRSCHRRGRGRGGDDKPKGYKMPEIVIVQEQHSGRRTRGV